MKKSVWTDKVKMPKFDALGENIKCDVLVIGGGLCGIICAYYLKNAGVDCVLVEGERIADGVTQNTTAKITSQHGLIYSDIISLYGKEKAQMYLTANENAVEDYKKLSENIECDFEIKNAYTYSLKSRALVEREVRAVEALGGKCTFVEKTELPFDVKGAVNFFNQAQFNPLKFICGISKDLKIFENTFVREIKDGVAITNGGRIQAKSIIVCTHFPFLNKHGSYFVKLYQHRSYVSAFGNAPSFKGMYVDEDIKGMSFSTHDGLLLVGGGGHRTGKRGRAWKEANDFMEKYYPRAKIEYEWATQDTMSLDKIPYIGKYSKNTPGLFVATGFNKWGMTSSLVAAKILCDLVVGKRNEYEAVFSPQRPIIHPRLFVNTAESAINLITPTVRRCPHLGCALKWNKYERTWDCPCHGSRFAENGDIIDNPAMRDADV